ncbi:hypothetical protein [Chryseobacterium sp. MMS23-Vi53]|uniref:hypothetical protein n=1 Tax=Chryseobacterium sp. MMS23-Vi53 TaxID=3386644 RepID=UPI0039E9497A
MKKLSLLLLLCSSLFYYSQINAFKIDNLSSQDITFVSVSMNLSNSLQNCVPLIYNEYPTVLPAGKSSSHEQINNSLSDDPPVQFWHLVGPNFDKVYDLTLGPLDNADTDLVTWYQVIITLPNNQSFTLGNGCMGGGVFSFTSGNIYGELTFISGVAYVQIKDI